MQEAHYNGLAVVIVCAQVDAEDHCMQLRGNGLLSSIEPADGGGCWYIERPLTWAFGLIVSLERWRIISYHTHFNFHSSIMCMFPTTEDGCIENYWLGKESDSAS